MLISATGEYSTFKVPIVNAYGRCKNNLDSIRFLRNKNVVCSYRLTYNYDSCINFNTNNFLTDLSLQILSYNSTTNSTFFMKPTTTIYKVTNKLYLTKTSYTDLNSKTLTTFANPDIYNQCKCNNIVTSVIQEFLMLNETITGYNLNFYLEDVSNNCDKGEYVPVNYRSRFVSAEKVIFKIII
jgi:hypothetical protein